MLYEVIVPPPLEDGAVNGTETTVLLVLDTVPIVGAPGTVTAAIVILLTVYSAYKLFP